jgi:hypothetical protein
MRSRLDKHCVYFHSFVTCLLIVFAFSGSQTVTGTFTQALRRNKEGLI